MEVAGAISGGMLPKVTAVYAALHAGARSEQNGDGYVDGMC